MTKAIDTNNKEVQQDPPKRMCFDKCLALGSNTVSDCAFKPTQFDYVALIYKGCSSESDIMQAWSHGYSDSDKLLYLGDWNGGQL